MKKNNISIALLALLLAASVSATAQYIPPPFPNQGGQPANTPIDGGAIALAAAGAAYGYKKLKKSKQTTDDQQEKI